MNTILNILGVLAFLVVIYSGFIFLKNSLTDEAGVKGVTQNKTKTGDAAGRIVSSALIILLVIVLYQQINAAVGANEQTPTLLNMVRDLVVGLGNSDLPQLR